MPHLLSPAESHRRLTALRVWLTGTMAGRLLVAGGLLKFIALVGGLGGWQPGLFRVLDTLGGLAILAAAIALGYRVYAMARHRLLWRVRRKLILSYIFIGVVPVLLVVIFFGLGSLLFFFNVNDFLLRSQMAAIVDAAQFLGQAAAPVLDLSATPDVLAGALASRQEAAATRYPLASFAVVPSSGTCAVGSRATAPRASAGPWTHVAAPQEVPAWMPCTGHAGLIAYEADGVTRIAARATLWIPGSGSALIVDLPFGDRLRSRFHDETGITVEEFSTVEFGGNSAEAGLPPAGAQSRIAVGPVNTASSPNEPLEWVALIDYTNWTTGETGTLTVGFRMGTAAVYRYLSGPSSGRLAGDLSLGQILLVMLAVVGALFLIIQAVAFVMGLALARSITGSVHALFAGTEQVSRGDFSHKIAVRSRDQLGELASSFNSMTASIEDLLQEKAEKERLEQELRTARSIQMSLLPQGPLVIPGLSLAGHCEPAREVGGDYYDFLPLDNDRVGILIADVAGKGTSAALYMAELKGLVLSLSLQHASPRQLLIDANRIISKHLDSRSFITMTYVVVDLRRRTLTMARAGHCPMIHVPGPGAASRAAQVMTPEGMVLGLQLGISAAFDNLLEEMTLPIGAGDLFLLYTDGISEAMNTQGDCFGDTRLVELAEAHADLGSEALQERILGEVHAFAGDAAQHDDMTMVLIKIDG